MSRCTESRLSDSDKCVESGLYLHQLRGVLYTVKTVHKRLSTFKSEKCSPAYLESHSSATLPPFIVSCYLTFMLTARSEDRKD